MPKHESEAFVLRSYNVGEQDKIITFFSRDKGVIKGVAKGARKFNNRFGSSLEPMSSHIKVFYYAKEHKDLVTVSQCDVLEDFFDIHKNSDVLFILGYFAELVEEFFPQHSNDEILFRLLHKILQGIRAGIRLDFLCAYFEIWLLRLNGFAPDFKHCKKCSGVLINNGWLALKRDGIFCENCAPNKKDHVGPRFRNFLDWTKKQSPDVLEVPFDPEQITEIRKILQAVIVFHMEKIPKSLQFLK